MTKRKGTPTKAPPPPAVADRCTARNSAGLPCRARPIRGHERCRHHLGFAIGSPGDSADPIENKIKTGRYSRFFRRLDAQAQEIVDSVLLDPDLLDVRRPVALQQMAIQDLALQPDEDMLRGMAMARSSWRPAEGESWDEQPEPTSGELELARLRWADSISRIVNNYSTIQASSARTVYLQELLRQQVIPLLSELGLRVAKLGKAYVPADKLEEFNAQFRLHARSVVVQIATAADK